MPTLVLILAAVFTVLLIETLIGVKTGKFWFGNNMLENDEDKKNTRGVVIFYRTILLVGIAIAAIYYYVTRE